MDVRAVELYDVSRGKQISEPKVPRKAIFRIFSRSRASLRVDRMAMMAEGREVVVGCGWVGVQAGG
jgi:hypothetical protein